jgi:hypothetical protein
MAVVATFGVLVALVLPVVPPALVPVLVRAWDEAVGVREAALPPTVLVPNNPLVVVLPVCALPQSAELHDRIVTSTARILVQRTNMEPPEPLS